MEYPGRVVIVNGGVRIFELDERSGVYREFNLAPQDVEELLCSLIEDGYRPSARLIVKAIEAAAELLEGRAAKLEEKAADLEERAERLRKSSGSLKEPLRERLLKSAEYFEEKARKLRVLAEGVRATARTLRDILENVKKFMGVV